jgi:hypothetical protein
VGRYASAERWWQRLWCITVAVERPSAVLALHVSVQRGYARSDKQLRLQLLAVQRFSEVLIRTGLQSFQEVLPASKRRKEDEKGMDFAVEPPHLFAELKPVHVRHHPIADDDLYVWDIRVYFPSF